MITLRDKLEGVKAALHRAHQHVNMDHGGRTEAWEHIESAIPKMARAYKLMPEILTEALELQTEVKKLRSDKADLLMLAQTCYIDLRLDQHYGEVSERVTNLINLLRKDLDGYGEDAEAAFKKWLEEGGDEWEDPDEEEEPDHRMHFNDGMDFDEPYPPEDDPNYIR